MPEGAADEDDAGDEVIVGSTYDGTMAALLVEAELVVGSTEEGATALLVEAELVAESWYEGTTTLMLDELVTAVLVV